MCIYNSSFISKIKEDFKESVQYYLKQNKDECIKRRQHYEERDVIVNFTRHIFGCFNEKYTLNFPNAYVPQKCKSRYNLEFTSASTICVTRTDLEFIEKSLSREKMLLQQQQQQKEESTSFSTSTVSNRKSSDAAAAAAAVVIIDKKKHLKLADEKIVDETFMELDNYLIHLESNAPLLSDNSNVGDEESLKFLIRKSIMSKVWKVISAGVCREFERKHNKQLYYALFEKLFHKGKCFAQLLRLKVL